MNEIGAGIGAHDAELRTSSVGPERIDEFMDFAAVVKHRRAELIESLEGARRKLQKQEAFLVAAKAEVERLEQALFVGDGEVGDDGVVSE